MKNQEEKEIPHFLHGDGDVITTEASTSCSPIPNSRRWSEPMGMDLYGLHSRPQVPRGTHTTVRRWSCRKCTGRLGSTRTSPTQRKFKPWSILCRIRIWALRSLDCRQPCRERQPQLAWAGRRVGV